MTLKQRIKSVVTPTVIVPMAETRRLGFVAGNLWLEWRGREYIVGARVLEGEDLRSMSGAILATPDTVTDNGQEYVIGTIHDRLSDGYPLGSYAAEQQKRQRQRRASAQIPRPVDGLKGLALLARHPGHIFTEPGAGPGFADNPHSAFVPGKGPVRGAAAIMAAIESKGVSLSVINGRLVATAGGGRLPGQVAEVLAVAERLLVAELTGDARCELQHPGKGAPPKAFTVLAPGGALACEAHAKGELELAA